MSKSLGCVLVFGLLFFMSCGGTNFSSLVVDLSVTSVTEQSENGTVIGTITVEDFENQDELTFSIVSDADGRFGVSGSSLIVADGFALDFETNTEHEITVQAENTRGEIAQGTFSIVVIDETEVTSANDSGAGTLRNLIQEAGIGDTISFDQSLTNATITLTSGEIEIEREITISANPSQGIEISGNDANRVFSVTAGGSLTISDLTIRNGLGSGGGIQNLGELVVHRVIFRDNTAAASPFFDRGAAIEHSGSSAMIQDSSFISNTGYNAGAIDSQGENMLIDGCTFTENSTSGNSGGAIINGGMLTIINSTFDNNSTTGGSSGGAIAMFGSSQTTTIIHSTITNNTSSNNGGGIYMLDGEFTITNSIVAGNTAVGDGPDIMVDGGTLESGGYNFIGDGTDSTLTDGDDNDQVGSGGSPLDPMLATLTDNGGETETRLPQDGSMVIDQIPASSCLDEDGDELLVDQIDNVRPANSQCDIGAVEVQ